ncbi:MbtH family NRPS accessory protein [Streptomyces sp. NPDC013489]|uniref:MbtH family NRPS accessory protein n=1 Tax=Streptomyces sp. NPDC013489 TaxID=3155606 RepID=UPI0033D0DF9D
MNPDDVGNHGAPPRPYLVLVNQLGTHTLWPGVYDTPVGWPIAHGPAVRSECLDFIRRSPSPGRVTPLLAPAA